MNDDTQLFANQYNRKQSNYQLCKREYEFNKCTNDKCILNHKNKPDHRTLQLLCDKPNHLCSNPDCLKLHKVIEYNISDDEKKMYIDDNNSINKDYNKVPLCTNFHLTNGFCERENNCPYIHYFPIEKIPCYFYQKMKRCRLGEECFFLH